MQYPRMSAPPSSGAVKGFSSTVTNRGHWSLEVQSKGFTWPGGGDLLGYPCLRATWTSSPCSVAGSVQTTVICHLDVPSCGTVLSPEWVYGKPVLSIDRYQGTYMIGCSSTRRCGIRYGCFTTGRRLPGQHQGGSPGVAVGGRHLQFHGLVGGVIVSELTPPMGANAPNEQGQRADDGE